MAYLPPNAGRMNVTLGGNTAGAMATVSTGSLGLHGGNNVTLSQNGNNVTISGASQANPALSGSNGSFTYQTATLGNLNGMSFYTSNGSIVGSYTVPTVTNSSLTMQAGGSTLSSVSRIAFSDGNGISFGASTSNNGSITITGTVATTYAASNHSHGNPTLNLTNLSGTTASASNGLTLSLSAAALASDTYGMSNLGNTSGTTGVVSGTGLRMLYAGGNNVTLSQSLNGSSGTITISAANQTVQTQNLHNLTLAGNSTSAGAGYIQVSSGTLTLAGGNNVTLSQNGNAVTISAFTQTVQTQNRFNATLAGNSTSAGAGYIQLSSGTLTLAGGNNITLSQNGNAITISGGAGAAISNTFGMSNLGNTSGTSGVISGSAVQYALAGGNNITLSQSINGSSATITVSAPNQSVQTQSIIQGIIASGSTNRTGDISFANSNNITFGLSNNTVTASFAGGGAAVSNSETYYSTGTINLAADGPLTIYSGANQSYRFSVPASSSISATGALSISTNGATVSLGVPAFSNGISNIGNTAGTSGTASNQVIFAGGNNITLSQSTAAGGNTISISAPNQSAQTQSNIQGIIASGSTNRTGDISFANSNNITFGLSNNTVTASFAGGGGVNLANSETTYTSGTVNLAGDGPVTVYSGANQSLRISMPQISSLSATGAFSISTNAGTISMGVPAFSAGMSNIGNTSGTSGTISNRVVFAGGSNITLSQSTNASGATVSISGQDQALSAGNGSIAFQTATFGNLNNFSFYITNGSMVGSYAQSVPALSGYAAGNTFSSSASNLDARSITFNGIGAAQVGISGGSVLISAPTQTNQTQGFTAGTTNGGNTSLTSTGTFDARSLYLNAHGAISAGFSNSSIFISAPTQSNQSQGFTAGTSNGGNTTLTSTGTFDARSVRFAGLGNVSVGFSNSSIVISGSGGGGGGAAISNSETYYSTGTINLAADGPLTIYSGANQSYRFSAAPTSSLSATGAFSISTNGGTISMGVPAFSAGISNIGNTAGTSGTASNQVIFAGGNNIVLSQSTGAGGNTITISASAQSAQTVGIYATGANTTGQSSSNTLDARSFSISAQGGLYAGMSGNTLQLSAATTYAASNHSHGNPTLNLTNLSGTTASASNGLTLSLSAANQSAQTQGFTAGTTNAGNTSLTSTGTFDARSLYLNAHGAISAGFSNSSIFISAPTQSVQTQSRFNLTLGGNSTSGGAGYAQISSGVMTLAGGNNITLSQDGNAVTISGAAAGGNTANLYVSSNSTQLSSTAGVDLRSLTFQGAGNAYIGVSQGKVLVSAQGISALGFDGSTATNGLVNITGWGPVSVVNDGGDIAIDAPAVSSLNAAGIVSISTNGTNITISASNNIPAYAVSNTVTANATTSGSLAFSAMSFKGVGNASVGISNGSVVVSAAGGGGAALSAGTQSVSTGTVSFANSNGVTFGMSGSNTITASVPGGTISNWEPQPLQYGSLSTSQFGNGSLFIYKLQVPAPVIASQFMQLATISMSSSSNSSHAGVISVGAGIYGTTTGSNLTVLTSATTAHQWTNTSNNSMASLSGLRGLTVPLNITASPGNYFLALWSRSSTTNANWFTASNIVFTNLASNLTFHGVLGQASNVTAGIQEGVGMFSTTTSAMPSSIPMSQITQNATLRPMPYVAFKNVTF